MATVEGTIWALKMLLLFWFCRSLLAIFRNCV